MFSAWWIRPVLWMLGSAFVAGLFSLAVHRYNDWIRAPLEQELAAVKTAIDKQKFDAANMWKKRETDNAKATQGYIDYARESDEKHDQAAKIAAAALSAARSVRLYDNAGRGTGSCAPVPTGPDSTRVAQGQADGCELSEQFAGKLKAEAGRADQLAIWAMECYSFVNK